MGQKSNGSATICFGLLSIPIKTYVAATAERVKFNMVAADTKNRVRQKLVDAVTGKEVNQADCLKGYEYSKTQYVIFNKEEIESLCHDKTLKDTMQITEFVPSDSVSPISVEKTLYMGPDKHGDKAFLLLSAILKKSNQVAIAKWYARGHEHLVAIAPTVDGLILQQLYYAKEVRSFENPCNNIPLQDAEIAMGMMLAEKLSKPTFDHTKYYDGFVTEVAKAAELKVAGGTIDLSATPAAAQVTDLFAVLQASLSMPAPTADVAPAVKEKPVKEKKPRAKKTA